MSFAAETFKPNIYFKLNSNCLFGLALCPCLRSLPPGHVLQSCYTQDPLDVLRFSCQSWSSPHLFKLSSSDLNTYISPFSPVCAFKPEIKSVPLPEIQSLLPD